MDHNLSGRAIVITGADGRLGQRLVSGFGQAGAAVAAVVRDPSGYTLPDGIAGRAFGADVTDEDQVDACFQQIAGAFGPPAALIHTVGTWAGTPFLETALADWRRLIDLNLTSAFLCFRAAARQMQGHGGRLIGIASGQGADRGRAKQGAYSASKAGVVRLVEALAEEFAGTGLTAHALAPSTILYDGGDGPGVPADDLVALCRTLCTLAGAALNGATLRAYGTAR